MLLFYYACRLEPYIPRCCSQYYALKNPAHEGARNDTSLALIRDDIWIILFLYLVCCLLETAENAVSIVATRHCRPVIITNRQLTWHSTVAQCCVTSLVFWQGSTHISNIVTKNLCNATVGHINLSSK